MYRQYENPYKLEIELEKAKKNLKICLELGAEDSIIFWQQKVEELKERVNFAWQDEEYDMEVNYVL